MEVIKADLSHVQYLSDFGRKSFIHAYQCTLPLEELNKYINHAFSETTIRKEINGTKVIYFVCQDSELNLCGYAKLIQSPPPKCINSDNAIELQRLYVGSNSRGQGVGKILELHAESYAKSQNISDIWLRVWDGNTVAQDIYKKWEFEVVGDEPYIVGEDQRTVLLMSKSLDKE
jgi:ribosomal protein S18 acetylase RimI-like enzyme